MHAIEVALGSIEPMLSEITTQANDDGITLEKYTIDHVCYRVATSERYYEIKEELVKHGTCIGEYVINGRPIATILLHTLFKYWAFEIECIELPAPKPGKIYEEGWEHAECAVGLNLMEFMKLHSEISFITDGLHKSINPEIERKYDHFTLKFHEHTLRYVVEILQA